MRFIKTSLLIISFLCAQFTFGQDRDEKAIRFAETITAEDLQNHLRVLASDEYEGRETAEEGGYRAAVYIAEFFESLEIEPLEATDRYSQTYPLEKISLNGRMTVGSNELVYLDDYLFFDADLSDITASKVQFVGFGIQSEKYNDYSGIDSLSEVVLMMGGEPMNKKGKRWVNGQEKKSEWGAVFDGDRRAEIAGNKGAKTVLYVMPGYKRLVKRYRSSIGGPMLRMVKDEDEEGKSSTEAQVIYISEDVANLIMGGDSFDQAIAKINKKGKPISLGIDVNIAFKSESNVEETYATNELAYIPGTDLADEVLVVTAHYDHIGRRGDEINNGADDDGSGTVSLLEIVEAFKMAADSGFAPRRSILFIAFSGEEKGLFGSRYYTENPVFPLEQTIADLNIDMVGRTDTLHEDPNYIYLIGSDMLSSQLHKVSEACNNNYSELSLDYTYNDPKDPNRYYYRSDHYNFAKKDVPVIFYFSGTHEDYHQPTDTADKILYEVHEKRTRLVFYTAWHLANMDSRPEIDRKKEE